MIADVNGNSPAALALVLLAAGCASTGGAPADSWAVPAVVLGPRMTTFTGEVDARAASLVVQDWLDLVGADGVRIRVRDEGSARIRSPGDSAWEAADLVVRWRVREEALEVQVTSVGGLRGDECRHALASLAFAMESKGFRGEPAPSSGCAPPEEPRPGVPTWREAIDAEFARLGLVMLDMDPQQGGNVSRYGPPGGNAEWRVDVDGLDSSLPSLELFHESTPFDARGERDLLARILRRLGVVPWGLHPRERMPSPDAE